MNRIYLEANRPRQAWNGICFAAKSGGGRLWLNGSVSRQRFIATAVAPRAGVRFSEYSKAANDRAPFGHCQCHS
jgi:hypothetical protein